MVSNSASDASLAMWKAKEKQQPEHTSFPSVWKERVLGDSHRHLLCYTCYTWQEHWPAKRPGADTLGACTPSSGEEDEDTATRPPLKSKRRLEPSTIMPRQPQTESKIKGRGSTEA